MYCTNCHINWAQLHSMDDDAKDEQYDYCPMCKDDFFLVDKKAGDGFIMNPISGQIINARTKEVLNHRGLFTEQLANFIDEPPFNKEEYIKKMQARDIRRDEAVDKYREVFLTSGQEAAQRAYFEILNTTKNEN